MERVATKQISEKDTGLPKWREIWNLIAFGYRESHNLIVKMVSHPLVYVPLTLVPFIFFAVVAGYFAFNTQVGIGPDESEHIWRANLFKDALWFHLTDTDKTMAFGPISRFFYLYHWTMGKFLYFNFFGIEQVLYLRLLNVGLGLGSLFMVYRAACALSENTLFRAASVYWLCFMTMQMFMSATVSYDNLANFFAAASIYQFVKWFRTEDKRAFISLLTLLLFGGLVKLTMIPFGAVMGLALLLSATKVWRTSAVIFQSFNEKSMYWRYALLSLAGLMFAELHIGNLLAFGHLIVNCEDIMGLERCMKVHEPTRVYHALGAQVIDPAALMPYWEYFVLFSQSMTSTLYGVLGHKGSSHPYPQEMLNLAMVGLAAVFLRPALWRRHREVILLTLMVGIYFLIFIHYHYFSIYLKTGTFSAALQGRYMFPVLGCAALAICAAGMVRAHGVIQLTAFLAGFYHYYNRGMMPMLKQTNWQSVLNW